MFAADAEAQQAGRDVVLSGEFGAPFEGGLDAADAGGVGDDLEVCANLVGGGGVGDFEAEHGPESAHLASGELVLRVAGQAWISDPADRWMRCKAAGNLAGGFLGVAQPDREGSCAPEGEEAFEAAGGGSGGLAAADESCVILRSLARDHAE